MAEYVRSVTVSVTVDTNKRTETATFAALSLADALRQAEQWRQGMDL